MAVGGGCELVNFTSVDDALYRFPFSISEEFGTDFVFVDVTDTTNEADC